MISLVAFKPPSSVVTVMVVEPGDRATTLPKLSTDATFASEDAHLKYLLVALFGATVAVNSVCSPAVRVTLAGLIETLSAFTKLSSSLHDETNAIAKTERTPNINNFAFIFIIH